MAEQCTGRGANGVVCAAAPLAAQAGAAAMRDGGNAFDAAVAAALAETVLLPSKCGLGGDLVAIVPRAGAAPPRALLAIGGAPRRLADVASDGSWSDTGPMLGRSPGGAGRVLALAAAGRLPLDRLAAPAIETGDGGFPVGCRQPSPRRRQRRAAAAMESRGHRLTSRVASRSPPATLVALPGLARALASFVELGDGFLAGPVGEAIVATVQQHGGVLDAGDLAEVRAEWTECAEVDVGARTVWATPAPTHGPSLLAAVADAQPGDDPARSTAGCWPPSTERTRSTRRSVGHVDRQRRRPRRQLRRRRPLQLLPALRQRAGRRRLRPRPRQPRRPRLHPRAGTPQLPSRRSPSGNHAARLGGIRRRRTSARSSAARPAARTRCRGTPSCCRRSSTASRRAGSLVTAPRWEWLPADDGVRIEAGFDEAAAAALQPSAPRAVRVGRWGLPCAQQVIAVPEAGLAIVGAADPRTVGLALGV